MWTAIWTAVVTVLLFVVFLFFLPELRISGKSIKIYPFVPLIGGLLLLPLGCLDFPDILSSFTADTSVNPIRLLILFLSMTVFSLILEQTGFFPWISGKVLAHTGNNQYRVFLALYGVISLLTVFTSNDIVILTFTPFICCFCRSAHIRPVPYLIMEFVAANSWSLFLMIGNPTNIYLAGAFDISFMEYLRVMALPTVACGVVSLGTMLLLFRKDLSRRAEVSCEPAQISDRPLMIVSLLHLLLCVVLLAVSQYLKLQMWLISLFTAASALICSAVVLLCRKRSLRPLWNAVRGMPFEIVPFVCGMFILVLGLDLTGATRAAADLLGGAGIFSYGALSLLCANLFNNIPMSVLFSRILAFHASMPQVYAVVIGSNLGAFVTPLGALAGIMWFKLLRQNQVRLPVPKFIAYGTVIAVPALVASLAVLCLTASA